MRRLAVLVGAGAVFFALVALAFASADPIVTYTSPIKQKGKPKAGKPVPVQYTGILDVREADGTQPPTGPVTTLYFAKQFVQMSKYFPSCSKAELDAVDPTPAKCKKALVGTGTATSVAGPTPGTPPSPAFNETLSVKAYNDGKHKQFLLVLKTKQGAVPIDNRVIPGQLGPGHGKFGYTLKFTVPPELQSQANGAIQIALTHFNVVTSPRTIKAKIHGKKQKVSYLMLKSCPKSHKLPVKAVAQFNNDDGSPNPNRTVTATSFTKCK
jgi:hypothetical protein